MSTTEDAIRHSAEAVVEMGRLRNLSDKDLCREYLRLESDQDDELHVNEMLSRLWPEWDSEETAGEA